MDDIDRFALKVERQIIENKAIIENLPDFESRKQRPLGNGLTL